MKDTQVSKALRRLYYASGVSIKSSVTDPGQQGGEVEHQYVQYSLENQAL